MSLNQGLTQGGECPTPGTRSMKGESRSQRGNSLLRRGWKVPTILSSRSKKGREGGTVRGGGRLGVSLGLP